jgi:hypothetical protein
MVSLFLLPVNTFSFILQVLTDSLLSARLYTDVRQQTRQIFWPCGAKSEG